MKKTINLAAAVLVAVLVAVPGYAARGSANFSNFVALGDSYGAGFESSSLNERHQVWSWPAVIARQVGLTLCQPGAAANAGCFAQPLVSFPGISNELVLNSLVPSPVIAPAPGTGQPLMLQFARPYNNLSIPGATVGALLTLTGAEPQQPNEPTAVSFGRLVLRGQGTAVAQAIAQHPTFIALWVGGNDYLSVMFSGNPATITSAADFKTRYEALLSALVAGAPQAGMVVGNLPAVVPPYLALVPAYLVNPQSGQPVLDPTGARIYYQVRTGEGTSAPIAPTTLIPLQTRAKLAQGYGLPTAFRNIPPFSSLPHVGEPLSQDDVITAEEIQQVFARVAEYNAIIEQAASSRNIPVADINGLFQRVTVGMQLGPITVSAAPVVGGFFSFDFFHLTDLGYLLFANEYIRAIND
ncbi:MAG TPA: SGNH/GDSL hydrolase family protein, partial [Thermoanaerobaculia bacterium]|nr:SGNH/GDSL hydrolase family protein [Thermoanaerobaculia bacterium]